MFPFILKQSLEDLLQNRCSRSILNKLRYACESLLFLLKFQAIGYSCCNFTKIEPLHWYLFKDFDEQPPEILYKKSCSQKFHKIHKRTLVPLFFKKVSKKRLWHLCFPVNFVKFLRTSFLQTTSKRLLLDHTISLILWRTTNLKNIQLFCRTSAFLFTH